MRILIVGAGGIGATYGAHLLEAGHAVTLVARGEHLNAMREVGLEVRHEEFRFAGRVDAIDEDQLLAERHVSDFDVVILTFKAQATEPWLAKAEAWLGLGDAPLLSLQNGVDNEPAIARCVGSARTYGGLAVRIGGHVERPGLVVATGPAQVVMGVWPDAERGEADPNFLRRLEVAFQDAGVPARITEHIAVELWRKLMINVAVNPLSALTGMDTRSLTHDPAFAPAVRALMEETCAVGAADGVSLGERDVQEMFDLIRGFDAIKTSMLVDREKGRELELEGITGAVLRRAADYGIATPVTALVHGLLERDVDEDAVRRTELP